MFFASAAALFAAQRANGTSAAGRGAWGDHPADGFVGKPARGALYRGQQASIGMHRRTHNTARYVAGAQWDLPPQDTVVFLGSGGSEIARRAALGSWFEGVLGLSAAPAAAVFFNDLRAAYAPGNMSAGAGGAGRRLLCARRGAMTSQKPRMFTTAADAWMFRCGRPPRDSLTASCSPPPHTLWPTEPCTALTLHRAGTTHTGRRGSRRAASRRTPRTRRDRSPSSTARACTAAASSTTTSSRPRCTRRACTSSSCRAWTTSPSRNRCGAAHRDQEPRHCPWSRGARCRRGRGLPLARQRGFIRRPTRRAPQ